MRKRYINDTSLEWCSSESNTAKRDSLLAMKRTFALERTPFLRHRRRSLSAQLYPFGAREPLRGQPHVCSLHSAAESEPIQGKIKSMSNRHAFALAPQVGLEPTTLRLTAACSTD